MEEEESLVVIKSACIEKFLFYKTKGWERRDEGTEEIESVACPTKSRRKHPSIDDQQRHLLLALVQQRYGNTGGLVIQRDQVCMSVYLSIIYPYSGYEKERIPILYTYTPLSTGYTRIYTLSTHVR